MSNFLYNFVVLWFSHLFWWPISSLETWELCKYQGKTLEYFSKILELVIYSVEDHTDCSSFTPTDSSASANKLCGTQKY